MLTKLPAPWTLLFVPLPDPCPVLTFYNSLSELSASVAGAHANAASF